MNLHFKPVTYEVIRKDSSKPTSLTSSMRGILREMKIGDTLIKVPEHAAKSFCTAGHTGLCYRMRRAKQADGSYLVWIISKDRRKSV